MAPKVNLMKYVKTASGWRLCPVVVSANGRVKPHYVIVGGKVEHHPEGTYNLTFREDGKQKRKPVGTDAASARTAQDRQQKLLEAQEAGLEVVTDDSSLGLTPLGEAIGTYLKEKEATRAERTPVAYKPALNDFSASCKKRYLEQINRQDLFNYITYLRESGNSDRTVSNKFQIVIQMLKANGITGIVSAKEWPRSVSPEPEIYTPEELQKFFAACKPKQLRYFQTFLMTGLRERELTHLCWSDVQESTIKVTAKPDLGFRPKNWEEREIPIPSALSSVLAEHKKSASNRLVFPSAQGRPNTKLLKMLKLIAYRAGLNCGHCVHTNKKTGVVLACKDGPYCDHWFLHKFRATYATMALQSGVDLRTVQMWMGHKDIESTMRYLKPARGKGVQDKVNNIFATIPTHESNADANRPTV